MKHVELRSSGRAQLPTIAAFGSGATSTYATDIATWTETLTRAQALSINALIGAAQNMGNSVFTASAYTSLGTSNTQYVTDLYESYLQRSPDSPGLNFWVDQLTLYGNTRAGVRQAFAVSTEFVEEVITPLCPGTSSSTTTSANLKYVLTDVQGSVRLLMENNSTSSAILARHDYLPYGEEISAGVGLRTSTQKYSISDQVRQRFALTERDEASGLDHTWFRKFDSFAGRWTSPDSLRGNISDPQSFNGYQYAGNDPINFGDPLGLDKADIDPDGGTEGKPWTVFIPISFDLPYEGGWGPYPGGSGPGAISLGVLNHPQNPTPQQQQPKPGCTQDKTGGDRGDIEDLLGRAGLSGDISNIQSAGPKNPEGITFQIGNRQAFVDTLNADPRFRHGTPFGGEHTGQVGGNIGNTLDYRSFTTARDTLGIDSHGFRRSLQVDVGPTGTIPGNSEGALAYADLDCDNPAQDVNSAFRHGVPIIFRRLGGLFRR
jgi:RHS repeat-associated protein